MAKQAVARTVDLEPIDRLEEKIKLLVSMLTELRADRAKLAEENTKLTEELAAARSRLSDVERANVEIVDLREEREVIRTRVAEMLQQLESI